MSEPWVTDVTNIKVHTTVPSLSGGDTQDDTVKQSLTLAMMAVRYPQEAWVQVFTDGSATNAVASGGTGILVHFHGQQKATASMSVGKHSSNYRAVSEALMQAASKTQASDHDCKQVVFLSDALSVLQTYQNHKFPNLAKFVHQAGATRRVGKQWIQAHCGNEQTDILAKEGAREEQHNNNVSFCEKETLVRALTMLWSQRDVYHLLSWEKPVVLVRLRTGHYRLSSDAHCKLKLMPLPTSPVVKKTKPVLQRCPLHKAKRKMYDLSAPS